MLPNLEGHLIARRLMEGGKKIANDLTKNSVQPNNILTNSKGKKQECMTIIKQVYNEHRKFKNVIRSDKTEMQYLVSKLEEYKYVYFTRIKCESDIIQDIFWAHPPIG